MALLVLSLGRLGNISSAADQSEEMVVTRTVSPDKQYEVRETADAQNRLEAAVLQVRKGGKLLVDLAAAYDLKSKAESSETRWKSDSKAFAYHYAFLGYGDTVVYRQEGGAFKELKVPKLPPMKTDAGREIPEVELNIKASTTYPVRWEKGGVLVLEEFRIYGGGEWETTYRTIKVLVPASGPLVLSKVVRTEDSIKPEEINR